VSSTPAGRAATRYRDLAHELGITVERDPSIGWSITTIPDSTAADHTAQLTSLATALSAYRLADHHQSGRGGSNHGIVAECACQPARKIRLSPSTYDQARSTAGCAAPSSPPGKPDVPFSRTLRSPRRRCWAFAG
jgi:hypothetical protein